MYPLTLDAKKTYKSQPTHEHVFYSTFRVMTIINICFYLSFLRKLKLHRYLRPKFRIMIIYLFSPADFFRWGVKGAEDYHEFILAGLEVTGSSSKVFAGEFEGYGETVLVFLDFFVFF